MASHAAPNGNGNGGKWWQANMPLFVGAVVVIGAAASYFSSQGATQNTITQLQSKVEELTRRANSNGAAIQNLEVARADDCRQLATVEVQMGTVETILNKTQAADQREIALLWDKAYGQEYPNTFYAVNIPHEAMPCMH